MNVAIIPARGGSKRIPRKNIKTFCGRPLISYSIETAQQSGCFDNIIVSTDDDDITAIARSLGAEVPFQRPAELANDTLGTTAVIRHALQWLAEHRSLPDYTCCLYATAPLLQPDDLQRALQQLVSEPSVQFVFSAVRFGFPIQRALRLTEQGGVLPYDPDNIGKRSQDLEPTYHDAGQFYWGSSAAWLDTRAQVFSTRSRLFQIPSYRVQDIDDEEDWQRAEYLYRLINSPDHALPDQN